MQETHSGKVTTYTYDALGQLIRVNDPNDSSGGRGWHPHGCTTGDILFKFCHRYATGMSHTIQARFAIDGPSLKPAAHTARPGACRRSSSTVPSRRSRLFRAAYLFIPTSTRPGGWHRSSSHSLFMQRSRFGQGFGRAYGHARNRLTLFWQTGNMLRETPAAKRAAGTCAGDSESARCRPLALMGLRQTPSKPLSIF